MERIRQNLPTLCGLCGSLGSLGSVLLGGGCTVLPRLGKILPHTLQSAAFAPLVWTMRECKVHHEGERERPENNPLWLPRSVGRLVSCLL